MTIFELFFFVAMIGVGVWLAVVLYPIGGFWLSIPAFLLGVLLLPSIGVAYDRYRKRAYCGDELFPPCSCGSEEFNFEVLGGKECRHVCQSCGKRYDKRNTKVYLIDGDQSFPYMELVKRRGWVPMNQHGRGDL